MGGLKIFAQQQFGATVGKEKVFTSFLVLRLLVNRMKILKNGIFFCTKDLFV
jgi:hypothetical protein